MDFGRKQSAAVKAQQQKMKAAAKEWSKIKKVGSDGKTYGMVGGKKVNYRSFVKSFLKGSASRSASRRSTRRASRRASRRKMKFLW